MDTVKDPFGARAAWDSEISQDRRQATFGVTSSRDMTLVSEQFKESFPPSSTKWPTDSCPYFIPPKEVDLLSRA
jgi:hypothetical protein